MRVVRRLIVACHAASRQTASTFFRQQTLSCLRSQLQPNRFSIHDHFTASRPYIFLLNRRYRGQIERAYSTQSEADPTEELEKEYEEEEYDEFDDMSSVSSGSKRKRGGPAFYAIRKGHKPGVYTSWTDAQAQIQGFSGADYKKFDTMAEAQDYNTGAPFSKSSSSSSKAAGKYYGVQEGHNPGVYTDWAEVQEQIKGYRGAKQQKFPTWEAAQAFVNAGTRRATPGTTPAYTSGYNTTAASVKDDMTVDGSLHTDMSATRAPKARESVLKKQKKNDGMPAVTLENGDIEPGTGPLPPDAEDGFDRTIILRPDTGVIEYKTEEELNARKWQPTGEFTGTLRVYTDGASRGNGQVGAYAGIGVYFGPGNPNNISAPLSEGRQTNQRAELSAIRRALDLTPLDRPVHILSDSNYAIKCVTEWFPKWRQQDWKNSSGNKVENRDIIEPILDRINERKLAGANTSFEWVKGHGSDKGNIAADRLAVEGAEMGKRASVEKARKSLGKVEEGEEGEEERGKEWGWIKDAPSRERDEVV